MRTVTLVLLTVLASISAGAQRKLAEDNPQWRYDTVRRAFDEVSRGEFSSWSEKYLARLGDSAAPEIMKCLGSDTLTRKQVDVSLKLVQMEFADPRIIRHPEYKNPTNTLALLDYIHGHANDPVSRQQIESARNRLSQAH